MLSDAETWASATARGGFTPALSYPWFIPPGSRRAKAAENKQREGTRRDTPRWPRKRSSSKGVAARSHTATLLCPVRRGWRTLERRRAMNFAVELMLFLSRPGRDSERGSVQS